MDRSTVETARRHRRRLIARLKAGFALLGMVYLALHAYVSWRAFEAADWPGGLATLLTLGFGDLWWAVAAVQTGDQGLGWTAGAAAALAFASWSTRGYTNSLMLRLMAEELQDLGSEMELLDR